MLFWSGRDDVAAITVRFPGCDSSRSDAVPAWMGRDRLADPRVEAIRPRHARAVGSRARSLQSALCRAQVLDARPELAGCGRRNDVPLGRTRRSLRVRPRALALSREDDVARFDPGRFDV